MPSKIMHLPGHFQSKIHELLVALELPRPLSLGNPKVGRSHSFIELEFRQGSVWHNVQLPEKLALRTSVWDLKAELNRDRHILRQEWKQEQVDEDKEEFRNKIACALYAKWTGLGATIWSFSTTALNPLEIPYVLMEVAPGERLQDQLLSLSFEKLLAFSEQFVSMMANCQSRLGSTGRILAATELPNQGHPILWTPDQFCASFTVQSLEMVVADRRSALTAPQKENPAPCSLPSIIEQLRRKALRLKSKMCDATRELYQDQLAILEEALDLFEKLRPPEKGACTFPWHRDLFAYNIIVGWENENVPIITIIDWDGVFTTPERWAQASPADIMLAHKPFADSLSPEAKLDLHKHAIGLLRKVSPGFKCADLAINHTLATIVNILEWGFHWAETLELLDEFGQGWGNWRDLICQEGYCSLQSPPPATGFWDSRSETPETSRSSKSGDLSAPQSSKPRDGSCCSPCDGPGTNSTSGPVILDASDSPNSSRNHNENVAVIDAFNSFSLEPSGRT